MKKEKQETTAPPKKKKAKETIGRNEVPLLDISGSKPLETTTAVRGRLSFCIVNTDNHGKRAICSKKLKKALGDPKLIQVRALGQKIIIGDNLDPNDRSFKFSSKATGTIYSSIIVNAVTETLGLDFNEINPNTGNKITTITLTNIKIRKATNANGEVVKIAIIRRNKNQ